METVASVGDALFAEERVCSRGRGELQERVRRVRLRSLDRRSPPKTADEDRGPRAPESGEHKVPLDG